jgi:hypothetical protein
MNAQELHEQRVLAGIIPWDRRKAIGRIEDADSFTFRLMREESGWRAEAVGEGTGFLTEGARSVEGRTPDEALSAMAKNLLMERGPKVVSKSRTKTARYIQSAMESLQQAVRATGHRKMEAKHPIGRALRVALTACKEAHDQCYDAGEAYDAEEPDETEE